MSAARGDPATRVTVQGITGEPAPAPPDPLRAADYREGMRMTSAVRAAARPPLLQVAKSAVATVGAWLLADLLIQGPPPVFAAIAALLVVQPSVNESFAKAIERSAGVTAGVIVASLLGLALGPSTWVILLAIVVALALAWMLRMTTGTGNQVAISAILVLTMGAATPGYAVDRILETVLGAAVALLVNVVVVPPIAVAPAREKVARLAEEIAAAMDRLAEALPASHTPAELEELMLTARLMRPMRDAAATAIDTAVGSLALNPRGGRHRAELTALAEVLDRLTPIVTQTIGMTRAFYDRYDPSLAREPTLPAITEQLRRAAHDVRREFALAETARAEEPVVDAAALTSPLYVAVPASDHWILIGSLMEDLGRVHDELAGRA